MTRAIGPVPLTERLRDGVYAAPSENGAIVMAWPRVFAIGDDPADLRRVRQLADGLPGGADDPTTNGLRDDGWLTQEFGDDAGVAFVVRPLRAAAESDVDLTPDLDLSRFAVIRREGEAFLVESPLASAEIVVHRRALLTDALSGQGGLAAALREALFTHGFLAKPGGAEDSELRLRQWAPHELLFHDRSRLGYRGYVGDGFGGTWWGKKAGFAPERAEPAGFGGARIVLPHVDLAGLRAIDAPFCEVVERRVSSREHDDSMPIDIAEVGELLFRTSRVRRVHVEDGVEFVSAPRPSGGSVYELELYLAVSHCSGLDPAFYHYDSHRHELEVVRDIDDPAVRRMIRVAGQGSTTGAVPQVLIVISARVGRVMWKYEGMGLGVVMKNTGVLYDALALACSAMGLAGCPLGTDDAVAFSEATGLDPLLECSMGQFIVGSRRHRAAEVVA